LQRKSLAAANSQSALLKILHWEPWENLDLAREPPFEKVWEPLSQGFILQILLISINFINSPYFRKIYTFPPNSA